MNLASILGGHPDASPALVDAEGQITYGELREQVGRVSGGLSAAGLGPDDRVAVVCGNERRFVTSWFAALGAGLVVVPLNPQSPAPELQRELDAVEVGALIASPAIDAVGRLDRDALDYDGLLGSEPSSIVERDDDALAALLFTSGTAGSPRAAMLTHGNLRSNLEQLDEAPAPSLTADDITYGVLPLYHIFGLNVVLDGTLRAGGTVVLDDTFDPARALATIAERGITRVTGPPTLWRALASLDEADPEAFASVRQAASGAAKLPVEVANEVADRLGIRVTEGYGLTETSPVVAAASGTEAPTGSVGRPIPGVQVRLVDADDDDVLVGDEGEVLVRGPNVFRGYWNDEEATRSALDPEGWLRTGDVAVVDDDGYLFLVDRAKDLVIVSGFNVYPAEVEEVLREHPVIEAAAVVGVPDDRTGEAVRAYVVVANGAELEAAAVTDHCAERLARYKCPADIQFVDQLPTGLGGKLLRRALR